MYVSGGSSFVCFIGWLVVCRWTGSTRKPRAEVLGVQRGHPRAAGPVDAVERRRIEHVRAWEVIQSSSRGARVCARARARVCVNEHPHVHVVCVGEPVLFRRRHGGGFLSAASSSKSQGRLGD